MIELITQKELSEIAGVSRAAISRQVKIGKLELFNGSKKINLNGPLTQAYLNNLSPGRLKKLNESLQLQTYNGGQPKKSFIPEVTEEIQNFAEKYAKERADKEEQARIKLELDNTVRRGDLVELSAIESSLMMFIDRWLNINKRKFASGYDELERKLLAKQERQPDLKREFLNMLEQCADEAKNEVCDKLEAIQITQARG